MIAEKKLLYELFTLAGTATIQSNQLFHDKFVLELTPNLKTLLKDKKIEDQIQGTRDGKASQFSTSISHLLTPGNHDKPTIYDLVPIVIDGGIRKEDAKTERFKKVLEGRDNPTDTQKEATRVAEMEEEAHMLDEDAGRSSIELNDIISDE